MLHSVGRPVAVDCRFFLGDRPCVWHKREGLTCTCGRYAKVQEHVLIIKLDAMGDVLRTTALLPGIARCHPDAAITWITRAESTPLLENNPYLTNVISYGPDAMVYLQARSFDRVINLDAGTTSAGLASIARAARKDGFLLHERGHVVATNPAAQAWLEMGLFDDLKRQQTRTYQSIMAEIIGVPGCHHQYIFALTPEERAAGGRHLSEIGLDVDRPVVGLNTGAGGRWQLKQWREAGFAELIDRISTETDTQVVLLGGPGERERNARLRTAARVPVYDPGCDNSVRHFAALASYCNVVVTGDTLALHVALAVGSRTVVLFGPTSATEIELYGRGEKVLPDMSCLGCYKSACDFIPNCMDLISVDMVSAAVERQLLLSLTGASEATRGSGARLRGEKRLAVTPI